jgi:hypothetical protein
VTLAGERGEHERDLVRLSPHDGLDVATEPDGDVDRRGERAFAPRKRLDARKPQPGLGGLVGATGCGR